MKNILKSTFLFFLFVSMSFTPHSDKIIILIDAGHGGKDLETQHNSIVEKDYTLKLAKRIIEENKNKNVEFVLLRDTDEFVELDKRVQKINDIKPHLVISLHLNKSTDESLNGMEVYVSSENSEYGKSKKFAHSLLSNFERSTLENRGVKEANFKVIRESNSPAFIFELGFISNKKDFDYLSSKQGEDEIVQNMLAFIDSF